MYTIHGYAIRYTCNTLSYVCILAGAASHVSTYVRENHTQNTWRAQTLYVHVRKMAHYYYYSYSFDNSCHFTSKLIHRSPRASLVLGFLGSLLSILGHRCLWEEIRITVVCVHAGERKTHVDW